MRTNLLAVWSTLALPATACSESPLDAQALHALAASNADTSSAEPQGTTPSSATEMVVPGASPGVGEAIPSTNSTPNDPAAGGSGNAVPDGDGTPTASGDPATGSDPSDADVGGSSPAIDPNDPYAPRSGPFKVLAYSRTEGFRHVEAIEEGRKTLAAIGAKQGFEVVAIGGNGNEKRPERGEIVSKETDNIYFNDEALKEFELVFMLNPTGDSLDEDNEQAFMTWMSNGGAMVGTHSATDFEKAWTGYKEYTMQYYDGHSQGGTTNLIQLESTPQAAAHPAIQGLPNPWSHRDEWYSFDSYQSWASPQATPGLIILGRMQTSQQVGKAPPSPNQPIMWAREWGSYRVFYTALGHHGEVFQDDTFIKHLTGGIMWAVRREHLIQP